MEERKNAVIYSGHRQKIKIINGDKARKVIKQIILQSEPKKEKVVSGMVIYPGKAIGKAKIILTEKHIKEFKKGEILIASVTNPSYLHAILKAKTVVADQGGITSYTAIVCRELKKISIINTKNATKVFKDGDKVLVDATKGIIKKL